jgi:hypothetical protein
MIHAHDAVVLGIERYKFVLERPAGRRDFSPAYFRPERFLDFRPSDTNITPAVPRFQRHYLLAEKRLRAGGLRYVGDKLLPRKGLVNAIAKRFPSPKFVFIYRDLAHVASSYYARANAGHDPWPAASTHETALVHWLRAFAVADKLLEEFGPENVFLLRYERLFDDDASVYEATFRFLQLNITRSVRAFYRRNQVPGGTQAPQLHLTDEAQTYLRARADGEVIKRFDARFERQLARYPPDEVWLRRPAPLDVEASPTPSLRSGG